MSVKRKVTVPVGSSDVRESSECANLRAKRSTSIAGVGQGARTAERGSGRVIPDVRPQPAVATSL
jgi:hypothetical protein